MKHIHYAVYDEIIKQKTDFVLAHWIIAIIRFQLLAWPSHLIQLFDKCNAMRVIRHSCWHTLFSYVLNVSLQALNSIS